MFKGNFCLSYVHQRRIVYFRFGGKLQKLTIVIGFVKKVDRVWGGANTYF